jgi:hypothetical protein
MEKNVFESPVPQDSNKSRPEIEKEEIEKIKEDGYEELFVPAAQEDAAKKILTEKGYEFRYGPHGDTWFMNQETKSSDPRAEIQLFVKKIKELE